MPEYKIKFNREELGGAFGDIGTDLPLLVAMIAAASLNASSVFIVFGILQIATGYSYKMPMPVQPLKAMATIVITQKILGPVLLAAGLSIGILFFYLSLSGLLDTLAKMIPKAVVRGLQMGLGISLCILAGKEYISAMGIPGYLLATGGFFIILLLLSQKKIPASLLVIALGIIYALLFDRERIQISGPSSISFLFLSQLNMDIFLKGFLLLTLPQIPLSLGNSLLATHQLSKDLYPDRKDITIRKLGITYGLMNIVSPWLGGVPVCHGAGGMMGHFTMGGRTGGSVIIYGLIFLISGLLFGSHIEAIIHVFPLPILGVILLVEGFALIALVRDMVYSKRMLAITLLTAIIAFSVPYGFLIALIVGTLTYYARLRIESMIDSMPDQKK